MRVLIAFSGGLDSATLLMRALTAGHHVCPVNVFYGSKHGHYERAAARNFLRFLPKHILDHTEPLQEFDLSPVFAPFRSSLLTSNEKEIPEGHYEAESMKLTVVPLRNMIFASLLAGYAISRSIDKVMLGIHAGDHAIYPDCRPQFFYRLRDAVALGSDNEVELDAPYLYSTKAAIVHEGLALPLPFQLTRTCYKDQLTACGKCGSCQERLAAFAKCEAEDPLEYESRDIMPAA